MKENFMKFTTAYKMEKAAPCTVSPGSRRGIRSN